MTRAAQETGPARPSLIARSVAVVQPDLRAVSLQIDAECIVALVGPNGGGKSTLLRVLAGVTRPIEGAVVARLPPVREPDAASTGRIGIHLAAVELRLGQHVAPRVSALAGEARCTGSKHRSIVRLRTDPTPPRSNRDLEADIVLVDSPVAFIDGDGREDAYHIIRTCAEAGRIVILATSDVDLVVSLDEAGLWRCDEGAVVELWTATAHRPPI